MPRLVFLIALAATFLTIATSPSNTAAQQVIVMDAPPVPGPLPEIDLDELASINAEATAATTLYVVGLTVHIGALASMLVIGAATFCVSSFSSTCPDDGGLGYLLLGTSGIGLVTFFVGVGLDVHSGVRRNKLYRDAKLGVSVAPLEGGGALVVRGTF